MTMPLLFADEGTKFALYRNNKRFIAAEIFAPYLFVARLQRLAIRLHAGDTDIFA